MDTSQSPQPLPSSQMDNILSHPVNDDPSSLWDWNDFLDFSVDDQLTFPFDFHHPSPSPPEPTQVPIPPSKRSGSPDASDRVRKRDPRMSCVNFLAGRIPCACPEIDEKLVEEEGGPGKKRPRTFRVLARCQVPDCEADISELKGYHRRHRVCLRCANATSVILDGHSKRYCQQCGKFHILSDFDEGKRSCRRKLERHNNRRRRKPFDSKGAHEKDLQQVFSAEDVSGDDETGKEIICLSSQVAERESLVESEGHVPRHGLTHGSQTVGSAHNSETGGSAHGSQNLQSDSVVTFAASGETQIAGDKDNSKCTHSSSYCDNRSALSSVCPTGRISFKLYDWNPAEFPRRLRHQIFQWLASMPVELEGYIRPGCTILTVFIAMPKFMWVKLHGDPFAFIRDFVVAPGSVLCRRGTLFIHLNNMIFRVMKDGTSMMTVKVEEQAPKLHYVHPTCFEAGKPIEFIACGSNLLQPKFRFLLSFAGRYLANVFCVPLLCGKTESDNASGFNHQLFKIQIAHTEPDLVGPAFIEVENQSGLSNFVPILIADKDICSEMKIIQQKFNSSSCSKASQFVYSSSSCEVLSVGQKQFCELIIDIGWLLKEPVLDDVLHVLTSSQIQRFNSLLSFLIQNKSAAILNRVLNHITIVMAVRRATNTADADMQLLQWNMECARDIVCYTFKKDRAVVLDSRDLVSQEDPFNQGSKDEMPSVVPVANKDMEAMDKNKLEATFLESGTLPFLHDDVLLSVTLKERPRFGCRHFSANKVLISRPVIFIVAAAALCFGVCVVVLHPQKVGEFATTIRRCVFDNS